jgi:hypothetical protein
MKIRRIFSVAHPSTRPGLSHISCDFRCSRHSAAVIPSSETSRRIPGSTWAASRLPGFCRHFTFALLRSTLLLIVCPLGDVFALSLANFPNSCPQRHCCQRSRTAIFLVPAMDSECCTGQNLLSKCNYFYLFAAPYNFSC